MDLRDVVETALAETLMLAAWAERWELVEQIARELRDRRVVRSNRSASLKRDVDARYRQKP